MLSLSKHLRPVCNLRSLDKLGMITETDFSSVRNHDTGDQ